MVSLDDLDHIAQEILDAAIKKATGLPFKLEDFCFREQLAFVRDPARYKTAVCSRRAGKTVGCAAHLISTALEFPGSVALYITLKRNNAKKLIWPELLKINQAFGLGFRPNTTDLSLTHPETGSVIYCSGAKDSSEIENFRGMALKLVYVDEAQSFRPYIEGLVNDVLSKALFDYNGTLCLTGTPGPIEAGYYYDCSQSDKWSHHFWTMFENPWLERKSGRKVMDLVQEDMDRMGVSIDHPKIQRECFGRWVTDRDSLLIHYEESKNHYDQLPMVKLEYIMGIDIGFEDADAIAVIAWSPASRVTYLVEESVKNKQGLTELVEEITRLQKKYDCSKLIIDEGGLGKKLAEEIRRRHHIPVQGADKLRKMENVAFLNDELRNGRFKAKKDSRFAQDSFLLEIDREKTTPDRLRVKDSYHSDIIDAVLYAFKESPAFTFEAPKKKHAWGTKEWAEEQEDEMFQASLDRALAEKQATGEIDMEEMGWDKW